MGLGQLDLSTSATVHRCRISVFPCLLVEYFALDGEKWCQQPNSELS